MICIVTKVKYEESDKWDLHERREAQNRDVQSEVTGLDKNALYHPAS
jgi:hypothetical protein